MYEISLSLHQHNIKQLVKATISVQNTNPIAILTVAYLFAHLLEIGQTLTLHISSCSSCMFALLLSGSVSSFPFSIYLLFSFLL